MGNLLGSFFGSCGQSALERLVLVCGVSLQFPRVVTSGPKDRGVTETKEREKYEDKEEERDEGEKGGAVDIRHGIRGLILGIHFTLFRRKNC